MTTTGDDLLRLRRQLREQLRDGATELVLPATAASLLLDELGRLQQANDRLRRQNRRVRRRLAATTGSDRATADAEDEPDDGTNPYRAERALPVDGAEAAG